MDRTRSASILGFFVIWSTCLGIMSATNGIEAYEHLRLEKFLHALAHCCGIDIPIEPGSLQGQAPSMKIPGVGQDDSGFESTITAFLAKILDIRQKPIWTNSENGCSHWSEYWHPERSQFQKVDDSERFS